MDEPGAPSVPPAAATPPLLVWALSAFHAALLVAVAVAALYAAGVLGDALAGVDTAVGVLAYGYLWAVTWGTNRATLRELDGDLLAGEPAPVVLAVAAAKWGGVAGVLVFLPVFVVALVFVLGAGGLDSLPFVLAGGLFGGLLAAGVGAIVGGVFGLLDLGLLGAARAWVSGDAGPADG